VNVITVTARDAAANQGTATLTVTYTPQDTTPPTIAITSPTSTGAYSTVSGSLNIGGSASDNVGVTQVTWSCDRCGIGTAAGTSSWTVNGITLLSGVNVITVTARDAAGNKQMAFLTVTYTPTLKISGQITNGVAGISGVAVSIAGWAALPATTDNSGAYSFTGLTIGGTYTITPMSSGYLFTPASAVFNGLSSDVTANFTGSPKQGAGKPEKVGAFNAGYWVQDVNGNFAWDGLSVDRLIHWSLGQTGEVPVIGDWNGDGKSKIGLYINGTWYLDFNGNGVWDGPDVDKLVYFGGPGYAPYVGDWNGSGTSKMAVHKDGTWMIDFNGNFAWDGPGTDKLIYFGGPGYTPLVGDWNGSGTTKIGAHKDGIWLLDYNGNFAWDGVSVDKLLFFGGPGYTPMVGDWNGSGSTKIGAHLNGLWILDYNGNLAWDGVSVDKLIFFGGPGYTPIVGDWNGSGSSKVGAYLDGVWLLDVNGNYVWDPPVDQVIFFGGPGQTPVVGKW
jgi:hypothetical protein